MRSRKSPQILAHPSSARSVTSSGTDFINTMPARLARQLAKTYPLLHVLDGRVMQPDCNGQTLGETDGAPE
jgi:hypothetical protein